MSLSPEERKRIIYEYLQNAFSPTQLVVLDDSAKHAGHIGSKEGAGHYTVLIAADCFKNKSRVVIHREIYAALGHLIPAEIHALQLKML